MTFVKQWVFMTLILFLILAPVSPMRVQAQVDVTPEPTTEVQPVIVITPIPAQTVEPTQPAPVVVVPVEVQQTAQDYSLAAFALFAAIALIVVGGIAGVAIRYVANLVPAEFAGVVYSTGNTFYNKRQQFIEMKRAEALKNSVPFDDLFWDAAMTVSVKEWQQFIDEAAKHGVVLQPIKRE